MKYENSILKNIKNKKKPVDKK